MKKIDVSFITINYNSSELTLQLIQSIKQFSQDFSYEIIVVDNNSKTEQVQQLDDHLREDADVLVIKSPINGGFASGNMIGASKANGEYLFFINNDAKLLNNTAFIMKSFLDSHNDVALCTAKVFDENGNFSSSYKLFPSLLKELLGNAIARKFSRHNFPSNKLKLDKPTYVEVVSGSCMFFRSSVFKEIGGFDTQFFLYCEEEDISKRVWLHNDKVIFLPDAEIYHLSGGSTSKSFELLREYYISYNYLIHKHFNLLSYFILKLLLIFKLLRRAFKKEFGKKILYFALKGFDPKESLKYLQQDLKHA